MKVFLKLIGEQIRVGTTVGISAGALLGLLLGVRLVSLENAGLLFKDLGGSIYAVVFLTSVSSLIAVAGLLPLGLVLACAMKVWPSLTALSARRFYIASFGIGIVSIFAFLHLGFNLVRDITSPKGILGSLFLLLPALGSLLLLAKRWSKGNPGGGSGVPIWLSSVLPFVFAGLALVSYRSLSSTINHAGSVSRSTLQPLPPLKPTNLSSSSRNVILISIDTLRSDHLSAYGYKRLTSPHLDRLARDGIIFRNARSQAPWTLPSHATMFTSLYPSSHGARFRDNSRFLSAGVADKLADWNVTLAEVLKAAGFRTGAFTSVAWLSGMLGFDQGFDRFEMDTKTHTATALVDKAIAWIAEERSRPFFLFLHFFDVHNYHSPSQFDGRHQDPDYSGALKRKKLPMEKIVANLFESLSKEDLDYIVAKYDGAISYVDFELGRLFAWLKTRELYDGTLVVITSDHGEEFWEHGGTGHGFTLYEEQLRVPPCSQNSSP